MSALFHPYLCGRIAAEWLIVMKKALLIIVAVIVLLSLTAAGIGLYITSTPEYALLKIGQDIHTAGIEGLYPHLTGEARETMDTISAITENSLFTSIIGLLGQGEYLDNLKSKIKEIQWSVEDILKSKEHASVILSFSYQDELTGTVALSMVKEDGQWKIDGLDFPEFDKKNIS